jgi:hypothetical protein
VKQQRDFLAKASCLNFEHLGFYMKRLLGFAPAVFAIPWLLISAAPARPTEQTKAEHRKNPPSQQAHKPPPAPQSRGADEFSHDAIMKEQERRDREQQEERDRDDLG